MRHRVQLTLNPCHFDEVNPIWIKILIKLSAKHCCKDKTKLHQNINITFQHWPIQLPHINTKTEFVALRNFKMSNLIELVTKPIHFYCK